MFYVSLWREAANINCKYVATYFILSNVILYGVIWYTVYVFIGVYLIISTCGMMVYLMGSDKLVDFNNASATNKQL